MNESRTTEVLRELRRALRPPFSWMAGLAFNLVLAIAYLLYLLHDKTSLRGLGLVGVFVMTWLLSDITATNLLGHDVDDARSVVGRRGSVNEVLEVRAIVLAIVATPVGVLACIVGEAVTGSWRQLPRDLILTVAPLLFWVGIGAFLSVLLPVRQLTLRQRWRARHTWLRWGISCAVPLVLSCGLLQLLVAPLVGVDLVHGHGVRALKASGVVAVELWGLFFCSLGLWAARWIAERRSAYIVGVVWAPSAADQPPQPVTGPVPPVPMPPVPTNWRKRRSFPVTSVVALGLLVVIGVGAAVLTARGNAPLPTAAGATVLDEPVQTAADAAVVARLGLAIDAGAEAMASGALSPIVIRRAAAASVPALSWVPGTVQSTSGTIVSAAFRASRDRGVYAMRSSSGLCWFATSAVASASVARVRAGTFFVDRLGGRCAAVDVPTSGWARELDLFRPGAG